MLRDSSPILQKIAYGENLSADEARRALNQIGTQDEITDPTKSEGFYLLALTFGMMAKGPTAEELYGFVMSISDQSITFSSSISPDDIIDISGTGGDKIKTLNVGTAVSFILAASGMHVAKQATRGYTGFTGSADIYKEIGLDPFNIRDQDVTRCLEDVGLVAFYTPAFTTGFKNRIDFLTKLKTIGLSFPTPWHLVSWVYSPFKMSNRMYGVFDRKYVRVLANLFKLLGYRRTIVVHGLDGLDEVSNVGETLVAELRDGTIDEYIISPEQFHLRRSLREEIEVLSEKEAQELNNPGTESKRKDEIREMGRLRNIKSFFEVLYGKDEGPKSTLVAMNAGVALYLCNRAPDIKSGIALAREIIRSGKAKQKIKHIAEFSGDATQLRRWEHEFDL